MSRREFTKETKRAARERSGGICEAEGDWYGLPQGERCTNALKYGVEYDHVILDANSKDNSLSNCAAVCTRCHRWKTDRRDIPLAGKTLRQKDHHDGVRESGSRWRGRRLPTREDRQRALARMAEREESRR